MARRFIANARVSSLLVVLVLMAIVLTTTAANAGATPSTTAPAVSSTGGSSVLGQFVRFTALVTGGSGTPTGEVDFYDGAILIGSAQLDGAGQGAFSTTLLAVGSHGLIAKYGGDTIYTASTSATSTFVVLPRLAAVAMTATPNPVTFPNPVTLTGTVSDLNWVLPPGALFPGGAGAVNNLQSLRSEHAASLLSDGTVLITGGLVAGSAVNTVELFTPADPATPVMGTFALVAGAMQHARAGHAVAVLADGHTALITGGDNAGDAELYTYNFATSGGSSSPTSKMTAKRSFHTATQLGNTNQVVIIGGLVGGTQDASVEYYDQASGTFNLATGTLQLARSSHTTTLVAQSGPAFLLLVAGGDGAGAGTAELIAYNTITNAVTNVGGTPTWSTARAGHTATLLPNGNTVLFAGGMQSGAAITSAELYQIPTDLTVFSSFQTAALPSFFAIPRTFHTATLLDSGFVLFTGGETETVPPFIYSADLYSPGFEPQGTVGFVSTDTDTLTSSPCSLTNPAQGQNACTTTLIPSEVGVPRTLTAAYSSADTSHMTGATNTAPLTVLKGTQALVVVSAPSSAAYGQIGLSVVASGGSGFGTYSYTSATPLACSVDVSGGLTILAGTGTCSVTAMRIGDVNYNDSVSSAPANIPLTPAVLTITPDSGKTKVYGQLFSAFTGTVSGLQNLDAVTVTYASTGAATVADAGAYDITISNVQFTTGLAANYSLVNNTATGGLTVTKAPGFVITPSGGKSKVYGDGFVNSTFSGAVTGLQNSDAVAVTYKSTGEPATADAGNYDILVNAWNFTTGKASNYFPPTLNTAAAGLTVNQAPGFVITPNPNNKAYGNTFVNATFSGQVTGLKNSDVVAVTYKSTGEPAVMDVGNYDILVNTWSFTTGKASNYLSPTLNIATGGLSVNQAPGFIITPNPSSKVYGDLFPNPTFSGQVAGLKNTDAVAVIYKSTGEPAAVDAGSYDIQVNTWNFTTGKASNYLPPTLNIAAAGLVVNPAPAFVITPTGGKSKVYGDAFVNSTFSGQVTLLKNSDVVTATYKSTGEPATVDAGNYDILVNTWNFTTGKASNYLAPTLNIATAGLTVNPAPAFVITPIGGKSKVYGDAFVNSTFSGQVTLLKNSDVVAVTYKSTGEPATVDVGPYDIVVNTWSFTIGKASNYSAPTLNTAAAGLTVNQAPGFVITPTPNNKVYGDTFVNSTFSGQVTGLKNSDAVVVTYKSIGEPAAGVDVGSYDIQVNTWSFATGKASNYLPPTSNVTSGGLTVTPAALTIAPNGSKTKIYGQALPTSSLDGVVSGLKNSDAVAVTYSSTGQPATVDVGNYNITATWTFTTGKSSNYLPQTLNSAIGGLVVVPAQLTVTPNGSKSKVYGQLFQTNSLDGVVTGLQNTDAVTVVYTSTGQPQTQPVGAYDITVSSVAFTTGKATNYTQTLATTKGGMAITPAATVSTALVTVIPTSSGLTYKLSGTVTAPSVLAASCIYSACAVPAGDITFLDGTSQLNASAILLAGTQVSAATFTTTVTTTLTPPSSGTSVLHNVSALYDGKDTFGDYSATVLANQNTIQIVEAAPTQVVSGNTTTAVSFTVPAPSWATAGTSVGLTCKVVDIYNHLQTTFACTVADTTTGKSTSTSASLTVAMKDNVTVTVQPLNTGTTTGALRHFSPVFAVMSLPVFGLLVAGFPSSGLRRRKMLARLGLVLVVLAVLGIVGCGGGFHNTTVPISTGTGTIPGTYYAVVTGTYSTTSAVYSTTPGTASTDLLVIPVQVQ